MMIQNAPEGEAHFISMMAEHNDLCGQFARAFGNEEFQRLEPGVKAAFFVLRIVNAAFFLQGKADQFTQQRPGDRKQILSSILDLEIWESYRRTAFERRKQVAEVAGQRTLHFNRTFPIADEQPQDALRCVV